MKANYENLIQALNLCGEAHGCSVGDYYEEDRQVSINSDKVPAVNDFKNVLRAFFFTGTYDVHVDSSWGFVEAYLDAAEFLDEVDTDTLAFALPDGWLSRIEDKG